MIRYLRSSLLLSARMVGRSTLYRGNQQRYGIEPSFRFNGTENQLYGSGRIDLRAGSYVGELCSLQAAEGECVHVGNHCNISHNVRVYTSTAQPDADFTQGPPPTSSGSVLIGDGVWIGANTYIGPGETIGDNAVVEANSVLTRSVHPSEIGGGVPARRIRVKRGSP